MAERTARESRARAELKKLSASGSALAIDQTHRRDRERNAPSNFYKKGLRACTESEGVCLRAQLKKFARGGSALA
jgi:hypothetical protein